jgi:hypothetical protein
MQCVEARGEDGDASLRAALSKTGAGNNGSGHFLRRDPPSSHPIASPAMRIVPDYTRSDITPGYAM